MAGTDQVKAFRASVWNAIVADLMDHSDWSDQHIAAKYGVALQTVGRVKRWAGVEQPKECK
jgi:hypothetical protein